MISSARIQALHEMFIHVTPKEWTYFALGVTAGVLIWIFVYRAFVKKTIQVLYAALRKEVLGILAQAALGGGIILANGLLFNLGEVHRNFLLAAFALSGIMFGLWVAVPEER